MPGGNISYTASPRNIWLSSGDTGLKYSLIVEVGEGGEYVCSHPLVQGCYGAGRTIDEAIKDYVSMQMDIYEELKSSADKLSYRLQNQLGFLHKFYQVYGAM